MMTRHQPEEGADSPEALAQAGIDQGYEEHIMDMRQQRVHTPGTNLGIGQNWILETFRSDNGNLFGLIMTPYAPQPFVTCLIVDEAKGLWSHGHYFDNIGEALYDFQERAR